MTHQITYYTMGHELHTHDARGYSFHPRTYTTLLSWYAHDDSPIYSAIDDLVVKYYSSVSFLPVDMMLMWVQEKVSLAQYRVACNGIIDWMANDKKKRIKRSKEGLHRSLNGDLHHGHDRRGHLGGHTSTYHSHDTHTNHNSTEKSNKNDQHGEDGMGPLSAPVANTQEFEDLVELLIFHCFVPLGEYDQALAFLHSNTRVRMDKQGCV